MGWQKGWGQGKHTVQNHRQFQTFINSNTKKNISFSTNSEATICLFVIPDQGFFFSVQMSFHSMAHESQTFKIRKFYHVLYLNFCKYIAKKTGSDQLSVVFLACTWWNYLLFYAHSSEYLGYFQLDLIKKKSRFEEISDTKKIGVSTAKYIFIKNELIGCTSGSNCGSGKNLLVHLNRVHLHGFMVPLWHEMKGQGVFGWGIEGWGMSFFFKKALEKLTTINEKRATIVILKYYSHLICICLYIYHFMF